MKHLIVTLLCAIAFTSYSQNGGQYPENDNIKFQYVGKVGADYFTNIVNKKSCELTVKTEYNHAFTEVTVPANGSYAFNMGTNVMPLKAKTVQVNCGSPDNGWIEFKLIATPLTFKSIYFQRDIYDKNKGVLIFETADMVNVKQFTIRASLDGKVKVSIGIVFPDILQPNNIYRYPIPDLKALKTRLENNQ